MSAIPKQWEAIKSLFAQVLELTPQERAAFFEDFGGDPLVREEVKRLVAEHLEATDFFSAPALSDQRRLSVGQILGSRFEIIRFIAAGGMGEVYEAKDLELRERIAIKTIRHDLLHQSESLSLFKREVHLARRVSHPNVCRVFDFFLNPSTDSHDTYFISMELLEGDTLAKLLKRIGRVGTDEILGLALQMEAGLSAAHEAGVVHSDFKPGNVILVPNKRFSGGTRAVITDFGLAVKTFSSIASSDSTVSTILAKCAGTPAYMAPEQIEGLAATPASDIYSFGLVLYEIVTGELPFQADTSARLALKKLTEEPLPPSHFVAQINPVWESAILRCLERNPSSRFAKVKDVTNELAKGSSKSTIQTAVETQRRVLDAASPKESTVGKSTEVLALVRELASGGLREYLGQDVEVGSIITPEDVRERNFEIEFQTNDSGKQKWAEICLKLESPDFEPREQTKKLRIPPKGDSALQTFLVTPKIAGELVLNLELLRGEEVVVSRLVRTRALPAGTKSSELKNIISVPLTILVHPNASDGYTVEVSGKGIPEELSSRIRAARAQYTNDTQLGQYESSLQKEVNEARRAEERIRDRAALGENRRLAEQNVDGMDWRDLLERSYAIKARHLDDPEFVQTVADIELSAKRAAKVDDLGQLLSLESVRSGKDSRPVVGSKPSSLQFSTVADRKGPKLVDSGERTRVFETPEDKPKTDVPQDALCQAEVGLPAAGTFAKELAQKSLALIRPAKASSSFTLLIIATAFVVLGPSAYVIMRRSTRVEPKPPQPQFVQITTDPADSTITSDGKPITNGSAAIGTTIEVSHLGYKTRQVQLLQDADAKVALTPEAVRLSIHTSEPAGSVEVDGQKIGDLADGALDEYELPADGKTHRIRVTTRDKKLFAVAVEVPAGGQPRVTSLDATDLFAVSSLGTRATWYAGSQLANARFGDQRVAVNRSGVSLTLGDQDHELHYGNGSDQGSFGVEISNAPTLALQSLNAEGQVEITSNVERGVLTVDGVPVPSGKNGWTVRRPPGAHTFVLSSGGYETRSVSVPMQRRRTFSRKIDLVAIAAEPLKAGLEIASGTPGANVAVDGTRVGELDSGGNLKVENVLTVGKHTVVFSKSGHEAFSELVSVSAPAAGRAPTDAVIANPVLSASAVAVTFESNAKDVAIKYRRVGETQFQAASAGERLALSPGRYEISAEAGGHKPYTTLADVGRETRVIPLNLVPSPSYEFQDLSQVEQSGDWFKAKSSEKPVYLKPGLLNVTMVFFRAGKAWGGLKDKKVEWFIEDPTHHTRIQYTLENQSGKFTRKLVSGDHTSDEVDKKVDAVTVNQQTSLSVHVRTEAGHILITNDKGQTLDDFTVPTQDFSKGKIGIRSDSLFLVTRDNS